jgi:hypothetical protein
MEWFVSLPFWWVRRAIRSPTVSSRSARSFKLQFAKCEAQPAFLRLVAFKARESADSQTSVCPSEGGSSHRQHGWDCVCIIEHGHASEDARDKSWPTRCSSIRP